ncbi:MAG: hypothetical protein Q7O12_14990 [Deltaproteobacteria bacterium]|nr:hypothetical protein [Deltaproteobacteria bacterium]
MTKILSFDDETIQKLFGHEAAEDDDFNRLKEFYFKSKIYNRIIADLPLRILVGHKGIGKSALFMIAISEESQQGNLPILIRPDDIVNLGSSGGDFLHTIRDWKNGLIEIISRKVLTTMGIENVSSPYPFINYGGKLLSFIIDSLKSDKLPINLDPSKRQIINKFMDNRIITVYIDDLDRGWRGDKENISRISALLNALRDISKENLGIRFRIGLRTDVYYLVRISDESTDKIEGSVVWFTWTDHEILVLLIKRIETFFGRSIDESSLLLKQPSELAGYLNPIMEPKFKDKGKIIPTYHLLTTFIRKRPRDLVKLCTLAARRAYDYKQPIIGSSELRAIFEEYSQGRLQDTINEYRSELPSIERLIIGMKPSKKDISSYMGFIYPTNVLILKIKKLIEQGSFRFANGEIATPKQLAHFMYKINFLIARKDDPGGKLIRKYFEENRYLSSEFAEFGFHWEIHPAYRWALQPAASAQTIYQDF